MKRTDLKTEIRNYLTAADALFREQMRDGLLTMTDAKQDTIEIEKWRELLARMEAEDILYGGPE